MLALKNISKYYQTGGNKISVLNNISLDIDQGEFVSIMGPSGSGKSTLLNIIGMLDQPSEGFHYFIDQPVHQLKEKQRSALYNQDIKGSERKALVADTLDRFNIVGKKDLFPAQLSGGQQQLVGIARAVIHKPALLLADEP